LLLILHSSIIQKSLCGLANNTFRLQLHHHHSIFFRSKKNWRYTILASNADSSRLSTIYYRNLNAAAQSGVFAHELSHVLDFQNHNRLYLLTVLFAHLRRASLDKFEYHTDKIAIQTGATNYLLAWKKAVEAQLDFTTFNRKKSKAAMNKRYMSASDVEVYSKSLWHNK
jgi:hypothetical protein